MRRTPAARVVTWVSSPVLTTALLALALWTGLPADLHAQGAAYDSDQQWLFFHGGWLGCYTEGICDPNDDPASEPMVANTAPFLMRCKCTIGR